MLRTDDHAAECTKLIRWSRTKAYVARRTSDTTIAASTTTDDAGRFTFDGLPRGDYVVAVESPWLDSLDLVLPATMLTLSSGERKHLVLAIPSGHTLRGLTCPGAVLGAGTGAAMGRVWDATDKSPLSGATLTIGWSEMTVDPATLRTSSVPQYVAVTTDSLGRFRACGVPTETYLDLRVSARGYRTALLQFVVSEDAGIARQDLSLAPAGNTVARGATPDSTTTSRVATSDALVVGVVHGATAPLSRVQLQRRGDTRIVTSDSLGRYRLNAVPLGTQVLEVRRVGYMPRQLVVQVRPGWNDAPDLYLTPVATLDSIRVVAQRTQYREFESRARVAAFGRFLRAEDIARQRPLLTSDLVRQIPGFVII